jgi:hypothetical protein
MLAREVGGKVAAEKVFCEESDQGFVRMEPLLTSQQYSHTHYDRQKENRKEGAPASIPLYVVCLVQWHRNRLLLL